MTLVLSGSLGTTAAMWDPLLAQFDGLATLPYDHRGHGSATVPSGPYSLADLGGDVIAMLDARGLRRVSFCGLSLGGMVGMWLAVHHPERIDRLVLCCTAAHLNPDSYAARAREVRAAGTVEPVADAVLQRWLTPDYAREHPDVVAGLRAQLTSTPAEGYAACCEAIATMDLRPDLRRIAAPTLCIAAREDPATPPEHLQGIAAAIASSHLETLSPSAHLVSVERARDVATLTLDHLRSDP
jgi:3-oxoadipate enol-lactonase